MDLWGETQCNGSAGYIMMKFTFPVFNEYETREEEYIYDSPPDEYSDSYFLADMYPPQFHNNSGWKRDEEDCIYLPGVEESEETHWDTWRVDAYNASNYNPISERLRDLILEAYAKVNDTIQKIADATKASLEGVASILRESLMDKIL